jgi:ABC-type multidrug transport system ATPase subunit
MCNRVVFINEGRVMFDGSPDDFAADKNQLDARFHELSGHELQGAE